MNTKNHRWGQVPIETCNSGPKAAVLHAKTTDEGWDPQRLVILMVIALFYMHKTTAEVWDKWRLVFLLLIMLFCIHKTIGGGLGPIEIYNSDPKVLFYMQKPQMRAGTHRDLQFWC